MFYSLIVLGLTSINLLVIFVIFVIFNVAWDLTTISTDFDIVYIISEGCNFTFS